MRAKPLRMGVIHQTPVRLGGDGRVPLHPGRQASPWPGSQIDGPTAPAHHETKPAQQPGGRSPLRTRSPCLGLPIPARSWPILARTWPVLARSWPILAWRREGEGCRLLLRWLGSASWIWLAPVSEVLGSWDGLVEAMLRIPELREAHDGPVASRARRPSLPNCDDSPAGPRSWTPYPGWMLLPGEVVDGRRGGRNRTAERRHTAAERAAVAADPNSRRVRCRQTTS
jgi:hypothetical protein